MKTLIRSLFVVLLFAVGDLKAQFFSFYGQYTDSGWYDFRPCIDLEEDLFWWHFYWFNEEEGTCEEIWLWKADWSYVSIRPL